MESNLKIDIQNKLEDLKFSTEKVQNLNDVNTLKDKFLKSLNE